MNNLLSIESMPVSAIEQVLRDSFTFKRERGHHSTQPLAGQIWGMIFSKSSTRTRVSFEVGVRELGGQSLFMNANEIQLGRGEPIRDTARVLGRMVHGAIIRTFAQKDVEEFALASGIPTINALTDDEHPCQILADLFTILEHRKSLDDLKVVFAGDGICNVAVSWMFAAAKLGFELCIAAPKGFQPSAQLLARAGGHIVCSDNLVEAVHNADVLYTDVWVSMGKETECAQRLAQLRPFQINQAVVRQARPQAMVMHCLPAYKGQEIDEATFETNAQTIFDQAENRLHAQKAIMNLLATSRVH
jgi:ornithine carbamoyltransferase